MNTMNATHIRADPSMTAVTITKVHYFFRVPRAPGARRQTGSETGSDGSTTTESLVSPTPSSSSSPPSVDVNLGAAQAGYSYSAPAVSRSESTVDASESRNPRCSGSAYVDNGLVSPTGTGASSYCECTEDGTLTMCRAGAFGESSTAVGACPWWLVDTDHAGLSRGDDSDSLVESTIIRRLGRSCLPCPILLRRATQVGRRQRWTHTALTLSLSSVKGAVESTTRPQCRWARRCCRDRRDWGC